QAQRQHPAQRSHLRSRPNRRSPFGLSPLWRQGRIAQLGSSLRNGTSRQVGKSHPAPTLPLIKLNLSVLHAAPPLPRVCYSWPFPQGFGLGHKRHLRLLGSLRDVFKHERGPKSPLVITTIR